MPADRRARRGKAARAVTAWALVSRDGTIAQAHRYRDALPTRLDSESVIRVRIVPLVRPPSRASRRRGKNNR